jgi:hypothetical protein
MPSITKFLSKDASSAVESKSKAYYKTGGSDQPVWFNKLGRDAERLQKWDTIYRQGGIAAQCVDAYSYYILSNGYRIEGENEGLRKKVEDFCKSANVNRALRAYITDSCVFGRPFIEKLYGRGGKGNEIVGLKPIDPKTMKCNMDLKGNILSYTQIVTIENKEYAVQFSKDEIWSDTLFPISGEPYGASLIGRAFDDIMHDCKIAESTAEAILRHGFPKYHIQVGMEGEDIDPKILQGLDKEFAQLKGKSEIATVHDVNITNLDKDGLPDLKDIAAWATSRMCVSMGIPEICLGIGEGSTEASAKIIMRMLYDRVSYLQKDIEYTFNRDITDEVSGQPGAVWLKFNDANPTDEDEIATWISKIMAMSQMDPTWIIPKKFIQDKLGINPDLYPDDEDEKYGLNPAFEDDKAGYIAGINSKRKILPNAKDDMSKVGEPNEKSKSKADKESA